MSKYGKTIHSTQVWTLLHEVTINDQRDLSVVGVSQVFLTLQQAFEYIDDIQKHDAMPWEIREWLNYGNMKEYKYRRKDDCRVANGTYVAHYTSEDSEDTVDVQWYVLKSKIDAGEHHRLELKEISGRYEYKEDKIMNAKLIREILKDEGKVNLDAKILDEARNKYKSDKAPTKEIRREWLDYCDRLVEGALKNGGRDEDFDKIVIFVYVCIDSIKHFLDIGKAARDLGISEMYTKYVEGGDNGADN